MSDASLERVLAFNRELSALAATGLPLDLGDDELSPGITETTKKLERISEAIAARVRRGQTLDQAVAEDPELTPQYRSAVQSWLRCDDPTVALDGLAAPAMARRQLGMGIGQSMLYPLLLMILTYLGFVYLCGVTTPKIDAIYQQLAQAPGESLKFLIAGRELMPI